VRGLRAGRNKSESFAESGLKSCEGVGKRYESQSKQYPSSQQIKRMSRTTSKGCLDLGVGLEGGFNLMS